MSEENAPINAAGSQDTRTRRTLKLRPAASITQDIPVSDPLSSRDTDTGNIEILDDTQTRKTLKLKPMAPASAGPKLNFDSGTNTRKTVVLRPTAGTQTPGNAAAPQPATVRLDPSVVAEVLNENAQTALDDKTAAVPRPAAAPAAPKVEMDDQTAAVPRPAAAPAAPKVPLGSPASRPTVVLASPAAAPAAPKAEVDDQTAAVPRPTVALAPPKLSDAPAAASEGDDQTVKMKRPPRLTPPPPPAAKVPGGPGGVKATIKLPTAPGIKPPAAAGSPIKPPTAAGSPIKPPTPAPGSVKPPTPATEALSPEAAAPSPTATLQAVEAPETIAAVPAPETKEAVPLPKPPTAMPKPPTAAPKPPTAAAGAAPAEELDAAPKSAGNEEISLAPSKKKKETPEGEAEEKAAAPVSRRTSLAAEEANAPSLFYLVLAVATLICVAGAAVITSVHYLDFEHQLKYYDKVPGLPVAK